MEDEENEEFWGSVGSERNHSSLALTALKACDRNRVKGIGNDPRDLQIDKACQNLMIEPDELDPGQMKLYCEKCGFICAVVIDGEETIFGSSWAVEETSNEDELGEFLGIAGREHYVDDEYEDFRFGNDDEPEPEPTDEY